MKLYECNFLCVSLKRNKEDVSRTYAHEAKLRYRMRLSGKGQTSIWQILT
jgi:hypothetical protein